MSDHTVHDLDSDADTTPIPRGQMSSSGHWVFGSFYAVLALIGFSFGVWAGAAKPKPPEVADAKKEKDKDATDKGVDKSGGKPSGNPSNTTTPSNPTPLNPPPSDPTPSNPGPSNPSPSTDPKAKDPDPKPAPIKPREPEPKPKEPEPKKPDVKAVSFKEVAPILRMYCGNCHGQVGKPKGGVDLRTLAIIKKGDENGKALVIPGEPDKSPLYESITAGRMPDGGKTPPSPKELQLLHDWIASGAKERRRPVRVRPTRRLRAARRLELTEGVEAG